MLDGDLQPLSGLQDLDLLSVGHNKLHGTLSPLVDLTNLRRLILKNNNLLGTIDMLYASKEKNKLQTL
eukprot:CAMPEP_0175156898 /NCGR_PEP_ID=MMETSP0087-20121206/21879_1 /TAXON_ID=136419 /ORGANISM="Unknown Unknown, Strain D1" /LENGTH=67 /DNA_ID=CAMNT_0016444401 /DNA_START=225 /DNA_END=428 /DNA_ORIENTATION=+